MIALILHTLIATTLVLTLHVLGDPVVPMDPRLPTPAEVERARQQEAKIATWREAAKKRRAER